MIHGIGVDLIEIDRIKVLYSKQTKIGWADFKLKWTVQIQQFHTWAT